jgi:hypothetical protein
METQILKFILENATFLVATFIQIFFLFLPLNLKNWEDDFLFVMTYVAGQVFIGGILFIIAPWIFEKPALQPLTLTALLGGFAFCAAYRSIKLMPLETCFFTNLEKESNNSKGFEEFFDEKRSQLLSQISFAMPDAQIHYNRLRERLRQTRGEENEEILEELLNEELKN